MAKKTRKVQKMLSPEEKTIISNIASLTQELLGGTEEEVIEDEVMMEEDVMEEEEVEKADMGPTANPEDKAEDRVEEPSDITAGNLSEVGKAVKQFTAVVKSQKAVKKANMENSIVMKSLAEISKALKSIAEQQNQNNMAISNIVDGIGLADAIQKSNVTKSVKRKPVANVDNNVILTELTNVLKSLNKKDEKSNIWGNVQKNSREELKEALPTMLGIGKGV